MIGWSVDSKWFLLIRQTVLLIVLVKIVSIMHRWRYKFQHWTPIKTKVIIWTIAVCQYRFSCQQSIGFFWSTKSISFLEPFGSLPLRGLTKKMLISCPPPPPPPPHSFVSVRECLRCVCRCVCTDEAPMSVRVCVCVCVCVFRSHTPTLNSVNFFFYTKMLRSAGFIHSPHTHLSLHTHTHTDTHRHTFPV